MTIFRLMLLAALTLSLQGCAGMLPALAGAAMGGGQPPQAPAAFTNISRSALGFAFNSFDAALYGFDFAMDLGKPAPGTPQAKAIAAAGRKVLGFLSAAEAARDLGSAATYEEAFTKAGEALREFRSGLGMQPQAAMYTPAGIFPNADLGDRKPLNDAQRRAILDRAERSIA
jgi:hypothetical protein